MLFDGYLTGPTRPPSRWTEDGWFKTGDVAVIDEGGFHRIVGRESTDLIKSGGYRDRRRRGRDLAARASRRCGRPRWSACRDADLGQRIVAYVVGEGVDAEALIAHVAGRAVGAQAAPRGPRGRRAAAQRDGQGAEEAARLRRRRYNRYVTFDSPRKSPGWVTGAPSMPAQASMRK